MARMIEIYNTMSTYPDSGISDAYQNSKLLTKFRSYQIQDKTANRDTSLEASDHHARFELSACSLSAHKRDYPTSKGDLGANITQKEDRSDPGDATLQYFFKTAIMSRVGAGIPFSVELFRHRPKCPKGRYKFDGSTTKLSDRQ